MSRELHQRVDAVRHHGAVSLTRRTALGLVLSGSVGAVLRGSPALAEAGSPGYGPLTPDPRGLLDLPRGFRYRVLGRAGERLGDGTPAPGACDGMGALRGAQPGETLLVRNHEQAFAAEAAVVGSATTTYDAAARGGVTVLRLHDGVVTDARVALAGTVRNCAGGVTPWGTWLSCEETESVTPGGTHGWVFEVDPHQAGRQRPRRLAGLGRFAHEAVCVDPARGTAYLTEDARGPFGLLYRFRPEVRGRSSLAGRGRLEALQVPGVRDLSTVTRQGSVLSGLRWRGVPDPSALRRGPTRTQLADGDVTRGQKLEGAWWGDGGAYVVASYARRSEGSAGEHVGQVWHLDPAARTLRLALTLSDGGTFDSPDNITVSPWGGVVLAEDGLGAQHLLGATRDGRTFPIARNASSSSELAGVCWSPDRRTLFANIYRPGITVAITGPWHRT